MKFYFYLRNIHFSFLESRSKPPEGGFVSLAEQSTSSLATNIKAPDDSEDEHSKVRHSLYNSWQKVVSESEQNIVDLQLPCQGQNEIIPNIIKHSGDDEDSTTVTQESSETKSDKIMEKTVESCKRKLTSSKDNITFKKRSSNQPKRNLRIKNETDD